MQQNSELILLDVGQGSSAIIRNGKKAVIIDAGVGATVQDVLKERGITEVEAILLSHSDTDHVAGVTALLLDEEIKIEKIFLNSDGTKGASWEAFRVSLADANKRNAVSIIPTLTSASAPFALGDNVFEVIYPDAATILGGPGSTDTKGRALSSNSVSAVIRVLNNNKPIVLFTGDIDGAAIHNIVEDNKDISAQILVYPHHGGKPKGISISDFSKILCERVRPNMIFFSNGRGYYGHPHLDVLQHSVKCESVAHIACSQITNNCMALLDDLPNEHFSSLPSKGHSEKCSCSGSISIAIQDEDISLNNFQKIHSDFKNKLENPVCKK